MLEEENTWFKKKIRHSINNQWGGEIVTTKLDKFEHVISLIKRKQRFALCSVWQHHNSSYVLSKEERLHLLCMNAKWLLKLDLN